MDTGKPVPLLHYQPHGLLIAFKIPLHGLEYLDLGPDAVQLSSHVPLFLGQFVPALGPVLKPQTIAGDLVLIDRHRILGVLQLPAGLVQLPTGALFPVRCGSQITVQLLEPLVVVLNGRLHAAAFRLSGGDLGGQFRFLAPQFQIALLQALGIGGHGGQGLLILPDALPLGGKAGIDVL